jgi:hypothetical protein
MPEAWPQPEVEARPQGRRRSSFRALRPRSFRLYFGGQVVSASGTFLQQTAIGWLVCGAGAARGPWSAVSLNGVAVNSARVAGLLAFNFAVILPVLTTMLSIGAVLGSLAVGLIHCTAPAPIEAGSRPFGYSSTSAPRPSATS